MNGIRTVGISGLIVLGLGFACRVYGYSQLTNVRSTLTDLVKGESSAVTTPGLSMASMELGLALLILGSAMVFASAVAWLVRRPDTPTYPNS